MEGVEADVVIRAASPGAAAEPREAAQPHEAGTDGQGRRSRPDQGSSQGRRSVLDALESLRKLSSSGKLTSPVEPQAPVLEIVSEEEELLLPVQTPPRDGARPAGELAVSDTDGNHVDLDGAATVPRGPVGTRDFVNLQGGERLPGREGHSGEDDEGKHAHKSSSGLTFDHEAARDLGLGDGLAAESPKTGSSGRAGFSSSERLSPLYKRRDAGSGDLSSSGSGDGWKALYSESSPPLPPASSSRRNPLDLGEAKDIDAARCRQAWRSHIEDQGGFRFHSMSAQNALSSPSPSKGRGSFKKGERRRSPGEGNDPMDLIQMYKRASCMSKRSSLKSTSAADSRLSASSPSPTGIDGYDHRKVYDSNREPSRSSTSDSDSPVLHSSIRQRVGSIGSRSSRAQDTQQAEDFASMRRTTFMNSNLMHQMNLRASPTRSVQHRSGNVSPIGNEWRINTAVSGSFRFRFPHNATGDTQGTGVGVHSPKRPTRNENDTPMLPFLLGQMSMDAEGVTPHSPPRSTRLNPSRPSPKDRNGLADTHADTHADTQDSNASDMQDLAPGSRGVRLENRLLKLVDQCTVKKEGFTGVPSPEYRSPTITKFSKIQARMVNRLSREKSSSTMDSMSSNYFQKIGRATSKFQMTMQNLRPQRAQPKERKEDEGEKVVKAYIHWKLLIRSVFVISLAFIDVVMAFVQVFWGIDDLYCSHVTDSSLNNVLGTEPRQQVVWTMTILFISYSFNLLLNISEAKAQGRFQILRHRTTSIRNISNIGAFRVIQRSIMLWGTIGQELQLYVLEGTVLIFSFVICWLQYWLCFRFDTLLSARTDYTFVVVNRIQLVVHFLRSFTLLNRCLDLKSDLRKRLQNAVSMNKRRFVDPGNKLDLDLTYVCDRLIAMAMPCVEGAVYRNDIKEVARFFATRHYGSFLVFNLCEHHEENGNGNYDTRLLYGQVQKLPFRDHNAPPFHWLVRYCEQASAWLDMQSTSLVAVHCQGGKGRTGCFCAALLLWTGSCITSKEALTYFKERRTDNKQKTHKTPMEVSSPSQKRYVEYIEMMLVSDMDYRSPALKVLQTISLWTIPFSQRDAFEITFFIECQGKIVYEHSKHKDLINLSLLDISMHRGQKRGANLSLDVGHLALKGDVSIRFFSFERRLEPGTRLGKAKGEDSIKVQDGARFVKVRGATGKHLFFITFHTSFHEESTITFHRGQIDGAHDQPQRFTEDFKVTLDFCHDTRASKTAQPIGMRNKDLVKKHMVARAQRESLGDQNDSESALLHTLESKKQEAARADVTGQKKGESSEPSSTPSAGPFRSALKGHGRDATESSPQLQNVSIGSLQDFRSNEAVFPQMGSGALAHQSGSMILHMGHQDSQPATPASGGGSSGDSSGGAGLQKKAAPEPLRNPQGKLQSSGVFPPTLGNTRGISLDGGGKDSSEQDDGDKVECLQLPSGRRPVVSEQEIVSECKPNNIDEDSRSGRGRHKGDSVAAFGRRKLSRSRSVGSIDEDNVFNSENIGRSSSRRKSSETGSFFRRGGSIDVSGRSSFEPNSRAYLRGPQSAALKHVSSMTKFLKECSIGKRQIELSESMKKLMKRERTHQLEFNQGDIMYDPETEEQIGHSLYYIESGSATWEGLRGETSMFFVNIDTCSHGMYVSEGDFYGTLDMITPRAGYSGSVLRAWTKKVVVKVLRVDKAWEYHVPVRFRGMDDWEVFLLMQKLAYETNEKCIELSLRLERLAKQAYAKHGRNIELDLVARKEVYHQLQNRFKIQASDELWDMAEVQRLSVSHTTLASGQACIFSNWLIFISSENKHDRLVPLSHIQDVHQENDVTVVTYTDIDSDFTLALAKLQMENPNRTASSAQFSEFRRQQQQQTTLSRVQRISGAVAGLIRRGSSRTQLSLLSQNMKDKNKSRSGSSNDLDPDTGIAGMRLRFLDTVEKRKFKSSLQRKRADISRVMGVQSKMRPSANTSEIFRADLKDFGYVLPGDDDEEEEEQILGMVFGEAEVIKYKENDSIVNFGNTDKKLYHIVAGYVNVMNAKGALMYKLGPGDIFGSNSFLDLGNRGFENYVESLTSVELIVISHEDVERTTAKSPLTGARIYRNICISLAIRLQLDLLSMRAWQQP